MTPNHSQHVAAQSSAQPPSPPRARRHQRLIRQLRSGILAFAAFCLIFGWFGGVANLHLDQPLVYTGDALETLAYNDQATIKNDFDTRLRAPFELDRKQQIHYLYNALFQSDTNLMWLSYVAAGDEVRALNYYYLATFLLAFVIAYWVCGRLGLGNPYRFGAATLYALMPYHFQRSVGHLWESSYYLTPLLILIIVQLWSARPRGYRFGANGWQLSLLERRAVLAMFLVTFLTSFHPYHQFFFAVLIACAAPIAALYRASWRPLVIGLAFAVLAMGVLMLKDSLGHVLGNPELALSVNGQALGNYGGAETYPLKLAQMVLPVQGHRWHVLAAIRATYDAANPLNNENETTTLGLIGSIGLMICIAMALAQRWPKSTLNKMGIVILIAMLFACMGGISSLISTASYFAMGPKFPLTQTRGWDRIIVFIGFFAYFSAFWLLRSGANRVGRRLFPAVPRSIVAWPLFAIVLGVALWDQVPAPIAQQSAEHFLSDRALFNRVDAALPANARVLQLPFFIHHASGWVKPGVYYTEGLRPYLASSTLHFTYGGDQGSAQIDWLRSASGLAPDQLAPYLCRYGFSGIVLHRNMVDDPIAIESSWTALLGTPAVISDDAQLSFLGLLDYCKAHAIAPIDMQTVKSKLMSDAKSGIRTISAAALSRQIGSLQAMPDGSIDVVGDADKEGWLAFGPYEDLPTGHYLATFAWSDVAADSGQPVTIDVTGNRNGTEVTLSKRAIAADASPHESELSFDVQAQTTAIQYRVYKPLGARLHFQSVRIRRLKNG